jgi:hypothetical protein
MRVKNWNYRELRERIADGYTLRQFTDFYCQPVPKHDAFNRAFNRLTPQTLQAVNELVVQAAVDLGLEDGQKLRVDSTVVQTDIHHPTDNTLLWDVVRVNAAADFLRANVLHFAPRAALSTGTIRSDWWWPVSAATPLLYPSDAPSGFLPTLPPGSGPRSD